MKNISLNLAVVFITTFSFAQGCSEARICFIGNGFRSLEKEFKNNIEVAAKINSYEFSYLTFEFL